MSMSRPTITQVIRSVLAAVVGIQSDANRQRDLKEGYLSVYLIGGVIFTVLFVIGLIFLVSSILG
jgi:Ca2+/Na+ antiporter